jgi:RimJ/RimL family protein N-acetyltransferase
MHFLADDLTLTKPRLTLRPLRLEDAEPFFALFNNWNAVRLLSSAPWPYRSTSGRCR